MADLFGNEYNIKNISLKDKYVEPPFSVLETRWGSWQSKKRKWLKLGIKGEVGRLNSKDSKGVEYDRIVSNIGTNKSYISVFDPYLCEVVYKWFCPEKGKILDPFCGGAVRGIVSNKLGYNYTGIDVREEQIVSNIEQGVDIVPENTPEWIYGDSNIVLDSIKDNEYDMVFTCPPYADLEVYSDLSDDISNMSFLDFKSTYASIMKKACHKIKKGGFAVIVIGETRTRRGGYLGLVPFTIKVMMDCGMQFYNEAILVNSIGSAAMRANMYMSKNKLVKIHQNILVFKKDRVVLKEQDTFRYNLM